MYNYLTQEDTPFPMEHEIAPMNVVCNWSYPGAAYATVGGDWHVDFLTSNDDLLVMCQNIRNSVANHTIYRPSGQVTIK